MIFRQIDAVLTGEKTQTRRLVGSDHWGIEGQQVITNGRLKWQVGKDYAVQPGRSKPSVGRIGITAIRKERLQEIAVEDCIAEGLSTTLRGQAAVSNLSEQFMYLWNDIHGLPGARWQDDPDVWVVEFMVLADPPEWDED